MEITRRDFLKVSGAAGTVLIGGLGFDLSPAEAYARDLRIKGAKETTSICCYCSVGCGILVHTSEGKVINTEGDPEHPVNEGTLCSKGASIFQVVNNENRLQKPRYRAPGATEWKDVEWDWALDQIARRVKDTRDKTFRKTITTKVREVMAADTPDESGLFPEIVTDVEKTVHGQQDRRHRPRGKRGPGQRRVLPHPETRPLLGPGVCRTPGEALTLRHCSGSGRVVRSRCDDESLERSEKCRCHSRHGGEPGVEPPHFDEVDHEGEGTRREARRRRSALHADRGGGRSVCAPPLRHRHRVPRGDDPLHPGTEPHFQGIRRQLHRRPVPRQCRTSRCRANSTASFPATTKRERNTTGRPGPSSLTRRAFRKGTRP